MKLSVLTISCFLSIFLVFELGFTNGKKYGSKSNSKSGNKQAPSNPGYPSYPGAKTASKGGSNIMKQITKPKNVIGAVVGGYVAHKVLKKVVKKPKIKIGGGGFASSAFMMYAIGGPSWGYRPYRSRYYYTRPISRIFVHHTKTEDCYEQVACAAVLQRMQIQRLDVEGLTDIGYNFMIGGDGRVYEGLGWTSYGHYRSVMGEDSISVAFIGDFSIYRPNDKQMEAFQRLLRYGDDRDYLKSYRIHAHRDVACTTCPGDALYSWVQAMPRYRSLPPIDCTHSGRVNQPLGI